jgi:hypothetical protein
LREDKEGIVLSLLEKIQSMVGCYYLSDLHFQPYNSIAKYIFQNINFEKFTQKEIINAYKYIFE